MATYFPCMSPRQRAVCEIGGITYAAIRSRELLDLPRCRLLQPLPQPLPRSHIPRPPFKNSGHARLAMINKRSCFACHAYQDTCSECQDRNSANPDPLIEAARVDFRAAVERRYDLGSKSVAVAAVEAKNSEDRNPARRRKCHAGL